jgi:hypothetical protein
MDNAMYPKGAEHRNIKAIDDDVSVRCTLRAAHRVHFYKYPPAGEAGYAALPLSKKESSCINLNKLKDGLPI